MKRVKRTVPLFVTCTRPGCDGIRRVRFPREQRLGKYCSRRCAATVNQNLAKRADTRDRGRQKGIEAKRRRMLARVDGLTPLQAFHLGYKTGLRSKCRKIRRLVDEIRAARAAQKAAA